MALLLSKSVFYHIPKTGGNWVKEALRRGGVPAETFHSSHTVLSASPPPEGYYSFTFVRDPRSWYQSYWAYRMRTQWRDAKGMDRKCYSTNFQEFVANCVEYYPGYVSDMYRRHVGADASGVDFVGRQETLVEDLLKALQMAGEQYSEESIRAVPPVNEAAKLSVWKDQCRYTPELSAAVAKSEQLAMEMFDYA